MQNYLSQSLVEETPAKVVSLLAAAMLSLAFLLTVSVSNASFAGTAQALPNPFAPEKVVAVIDTAAASYSSFLSANFIQPLTSSYKVYGENLSWLMQESGIAYALGIDGLFESQSASASGQVAGAFIGR